MLGDSSPSIVKSALSRGGPAQSRVVRAAEQGRFAWRGCEQSLPFLPAVQGTEAHDATEGNANEGVDAKVLCKL